jgi:hypothetical protein
LEDPIQSGHRIIKQPTMKILQNSKKKSSRLGEQQTLLAYHLANIIVRYQRIIALKLQSIFTRFPQQMQKCAIVLFFVMATFYSTSLIFKKGLIQISIKSIKEMPIKKVSSIDSIQKLEIIYQTYLKR